MARRLGPNLGGKPDKLCRDALMLELADEITITEGPERGRKFKKLRLVARSMVNSAIKGDVSAMKEIFDRVDGKVTLKVAGDPDAPIKHEHAGEIKADVDVRSEVELQPFDPAVLAKLTVDELVRLYGEEIGEKSRGQPEPKARRPRNRTVSKKR